MPVWVNFAEQDNRFCLLSEEIEIYRTYLKIDANRIHTYK